MWLAAFVPVISGLLLGSHSTHATPRRFRAFSKMPMPTSESNSAHPNRLAANRASLELLAALPNEEGDRSEEHIREMDAAEALWYRLKEERRQLQNEGEPRAAKQAFERAERAGTAYTACLDICIEDNFGRLCQAGRTEEADELRSVLTDCEQLVHEHGELWELRKQRGAEPAADAWSKAELMEALFKPLDARAEKLAEEGGYLEDYFREMKEIDAGLPRGTLGRLAKVFLAAPPARPRDTKEKCEREGAQNTMLSFRLINTPFHCCSKVADSRLQHLRSSLLHPLSVLSRGVACHGHVIKTRRQDVQYDQQ